MNKSFPIILALPLILALAASDARSASIRTLYKLTTGNGYGFQIFNVSGDSKMRITEFLEHPYRHLKPHPSNPTWDGEIRRNLAYDIYFGVRAGSSAGWLPDSDKNVAYEEETNVIRSTGTVGQVETASHYFAPFGYAGNAMVMLLQVTNKGTSSVAVDAFAMLNFHMGTKQTSGNCLSNNETITYDTTTKVGTETGPGGGLLMYVPISADKASCASGNYDAVKAGQDISGTASCSNQNDVSMAYQKSLGTLAPQASAWWGLVVLYDDNSSNKATALSAWSTFLGSKTAEQLHKAVLDEWKAWRKPILANVVKNAQEQAIYRQAEAVLRMGQVLEPWSSSPTMKNHGMVLASLPPGKWHTGWVRDAMYAIVALARTGHFTEAKKGVEFFLNAEAGDKTANGGFKSYLNNADYRISVCRYFGNGVEEGDYSGQPSPNIETDGWGMYLWAARQYVDQSGDKTWLSQKTRYGETIYDVIKTKVADAIEKNLDATANIMMADASIWEVHWDKREHFFYTSAAAARGLCDMAALATRMGKTTDAAKYEALHKKIVAGIKKNFADYNSVLAGSTEKLAKGANYRDGATVEAVTWDLFKPSDTVAKATMDAFVALQTKCGGYKRIEGSSDKYDTDEWILIDLRASDAFRRLGNVQQADKLLKWVTDQAVPNFNLLPELYDVNSANCSYTGEIPMVGYGSGAYIMTLLERAGYTEPRSCTDPPPILDGKPAPGDQPVFPKDLGPIISGEGGQTVNPKDGATGLACLCETAVGVHDLPSVLLSWGLIALVLLVSRRCRRA